MTDTGWIVIPRWDEFQHYKDRDPSWIKNQRALLHSNEYRQLSFALRGVLHSLWLEYASSNGQVPDDPRSLTWLLGQRVTRRMLDSLNHAGFVHFSASKPLALRYQLASPRALEEKNPLRGSSKRRRRAPRSGDGATGLVDVNAIGGEWECEVCRIRKKSMQALAEHLENVHGLVRT